MIKRLKAQCKECGKTFIKTKASRVFHCSKSCQFKYRKHERVCVNIECAKAFYPIQPTQNSCSRECAVIYNSFEYKARHGVGGRLGGLLRLRFEVFKRDNFSCVYCGRNVKADSIKLECDHVVPNGQNILSNLVTACRECNQGKKDVLLHERLK